MSFDFSLLACFLILAVGLPIDLSVLYLVTRLRKSQGRLNALGEMFPDLSAEDRRFVRWVTVRTLEREKRAQTSLLEPGKPLPWNEP